MSSKGAAFHTVEAKKEKAGSIAGGTTGATTKTMYRFHGFLPYAGPNDSDLHIESTHDTLDKVVLAALGFLGIEWDVETGKYDCVNTDYYMDFPSFVPREWIAVDDERGFAFEDFHKIVAVFRKNIEREGQYRVEGGWYGNPYFEVTPMETSA